MLGLSKCVKPQCLHSAPDYLTGKREETDILKRLSHGQRIDHYETLRQRASDLCEISLTIPRRRPLLGDSKIARDITEQNGHNEPCPKRKRDGALPLKVLGMVSLRRIEKGG
jgi:hypothetical protein